MDALSIILIFIGLILLILLILWLYKSYKSENPVEAERKTLIDGQRDATEYSSISKDEIPLSVQGNEYSISMWLFIKDYNYRYGNNKVLLYRGDKDNNESNPYIYFEPESNNMKIRVQLQSKKGTTSTTEHFRVSMPLDYYKSNVSGNEVIIGSQLMDAGIDNPYEKECTIEPFDPNPSPPPIDARLERIEVQLQKLMAGKGNSEDGDNEEGEDDEYLDSNGETSKMPVMYDECTVKNIPIQKWVHVVITVTNNSIEVYLDGKLYQTCPLKGAPKPSLDNMHVTANGGFNGFITQLEYSNMALPFTRIKKIYKKGPQLKATMMDKVKGVGTATKNLFIE